MKLMNIKVTDITESYAKDFVKTTKHFIESVMAFDGWGELYDELKKMNEEHEKEIEKMNYEKN